MVAFFIGWLITTITANIGTIAVMVLLWKQPKIRRKLMAWSLEIINETAKWIDDEEV